MTNDQGEYSFAAVPPGTYYRQGVAHRVQDLREQKGIRIGAQQFVTLDVALDVGQLQETITVTGAAPLIDTSNASTGGSHRLAASSKPSQAAAARRSSSR